jgi:conjugative transfer signal peptidase TraF
MKRKPHTVLVAGAAACALMAATYALASSKRVILNTTASAPLGLYWLSDEPPKVGDLALVRPPQGLARWMAVRGYLPLNVPLIKHVAALEGQSVCVQDGVVAIDGRIVGKVLILDLVGRRLNAAAICRSVRADEVFLLNADAPRSLDGRYFGTLPRTSIAGRLHPVWTWER